jgi:hypothetical protein
MYIMAPEPISKAYLVNPPDQSVCLYVYPIIVAKQRLDKTLPRQQHKNRWTRRFLPRTSSFLILIQNINRGIDENIILK